jgi:diguanylate cyclase (GGDEF)-like protein
VRHADDTSGQRNSSRRRSALAAHSANADAGGGSRRPVRRLLRLSIRSSLVVVVLIPLTVAVGLASSVVLHQSTTRHQALMASQSSLVLDSLLRDRADVYAEYVATLAIVAATAHGLSGSQLDQLLGVDFQADLTSARRLVDAQAIFRSKGSLAADHTHLVILRRAIDGGTVSAGEIETFFNQLGTTIDARWQKTFQLLTDANGSSSSVAARDRLDALGRTFNAFVAGLGEENLPEGGTLETILTAVATSAQVQGLIVNHEEFEASVHGFPAGLGPRGTAAWRVLQDNKLTASFSGYVQLAIAVGLGHEAPPFATNAAAIGGIARSLVEWDTALTDLVLASSADLRVTTASQAGAATRTLSLTLLFVLLLILVVIGGVLVLDRAIRRPLARVTAAAESVRNGELDLTELDESGPKELSLTAAAFNAMSATLRAVQSQAMALAEGDLDDPILQSPLPGRTGGALQSALSALHMSVRAGEAQREVLKERATRDFLTDLMNREAALEALALDLARVRRSSHGLVLAVLFIDLDNLKRINDSLGHDGGDRALRTVADALRATTRASDIVARFGGDEFVVGSLASADSGAPLLLAERVRHYVSTLEVTGDGGSIALGCSIGVALSEPTDTTVESLIERADHALYMAKASGRGQVRSFASPVSHQS